jgi:hypothetical protein
LVNFTRFGKLHQEKSGNPAMHLSLSSEPQHFMAIWQILRLLVYLKVIWYILPVWVSCRKKNLATLPLTDKKCVANQGDQIGRRR